IPGSSTGQARASTRLCWDPHKELTMHCLARIACLTLPFLMLSLAPPLGARAQDAPVKPEGQGQGRVEIDTNLFCDTSQQVERFLSLLDEKKGSAEAAIAGVNQENETQDACVIATAAFRRAGVTATVRNNEATFDVTRIVVIGVYTVNGLERSMPTEFYTLV